ncbi:MAG: hypothetical protein RXR43_11690 [Sulfolobus sp.]
MVERILLKTLYQNVGVFEIEDGQYVAALVSGNNMEIWGRGKTPYEAIINAKEKWGNSFGGFNPFAQTLQSTI